MSFIQLHLPRRESLPCLWPGHSGSGICATNLPCSPGAVLIEAQDINWPLTSKITQALSDVIYNTGGEDEGGPGRRLCWEDAQQGRYSQSTWQGAPDWVRITRVARSEQEGRGVAQTRQWSLSRPYWDGNWLLDHRHALPWGKGFSQGSVLRTLIQNQSRHLGNVTKIIWSCKFLSPGMKHILSDLEGNTLFSLAVENQ